MSNKNKLAENLKKYRMKLHLTQSDVAEIIDKDRSSIAKYESGAAQPPFNVLNLFSRLYEVTIDELCGLTPPTALTIKSEDKENDTFDSLTSNFDKQEQLMLLKFKMMDKEKKQEFLKILNEFSKK